MVNVKQSESPDSIPSLAETSFASSQEDGAEDVARVLFVHSAGDNLGQEVVANIHKLAEGSTAHDKEEVGAAEISITSSETTEVAAHNLSPKSDSDAPTTHEKRNVFHIIKASSIVHNSSDEEDDDEGSIDDRMGAFPTPEDPTRKRRTKVSVVKTGGSDDDTVSPDAMKNPSFVMEDPPTNFASCNRAALALTPKQLSDIFNSFEGKKNIWSMRQNYSSQETSTKEAPNVSPLKELETARSTATRWMDGWMPQNESLERECETLKEVLEDNSNKLLNLREAVETQRALNALKEVEIEDKEKELQNTKQEREALKKDKEVFREREKELLETIKILNDEVDILTQRGTESVEEEDNSLSNKASEAEMNEPLNETKDLHSHFLEQEPFDEAEDLHSRIRDQEALITKLQENIKEKEQEFHRLMQSHALKRAAEENLGTGDAPSATSVHVTESPQEDEECESQYKENEDQQIVESNCPHPPSGLVAGLRKGLEEKEHDNQRLALAQKFQNGQVSGLRRCLERKEKEIKNRALAIKQTKSRQDEAEGHLQIKLIPETHTAQAAPESSSKLMEIIASLSKRLEAVEAESQRECGSIKNSEKREDEIDQITSRRMQNEEKEPRETVFAVEKEQEKIEVMLQCQKYGNNPEKGQSGAAPPIDETQTCCCWSAAITGNLE
jgi:hypothetical protein